MYASLDEPDVILPRSLVACDTPLFFRVDTVENPFFCRKSFKLVGVHLNENLKWRGDRVHHLAY